MISLSFHVSDAGKVLAGVNTTIWINIHRHNLWSKNASFTEHTKLMCVYFSTALMQFAIDATPRTTASSLSNSHCPAITVHSLRSSQPQASSASYLICQWRGGLDSIYCPGQRGFRFYWALKRTRDCTCIEAGSMRGINFYRTKVTFAVTQVKV
jgi:hypothetical protein